LRTGRATPATFVSWEIGESKVVVAQDDTNFVITVIDLDA
jgi:hypothetical protein